MQNTSLHIQMLQSDCQKADHREYILVEMLLPVLVEVLLNWQSHSDQNMTLTGSLLFVDLQIK